MEGKYHIPIQISELSGIERNEEPVTVGLPVKKGELFEKDNLCLFNGRKKIPVQTKILSKWPDQSIKWILIDFKFSTDKKKKYNLNIKKGKNQSIRENFNFNIKDLKKILNQIIFIDSENIKSKSVFGNPVFELDGKIRKTIKFEGSFRSNKSKNLKLIAKFDIYSGSKLIRLDLTLRNTNASKHKNGFWDLGSKGSVFFKDLSLELKTKDSCRVFFKEKPRKKFKEINDVMIYQDSSGNKNWKNRNHVNKNNEITTKFRGYKIFSESSEIGSGNQANPVVKVENERLHISASLKDFWQNFPKSIEAGKNNVKIGIFPRQYSDIYELQGGEQKTHTIFIDFEGKDISWVQNPLFVSSTPEYYEKTKAIPYLTSQKNYDKRYKKLIECAIKGRDSFEKKNEKIDEYGWRNFGDVYADHEAVNKKGLISHYNNQYDLIYGSVFQFFRTANQKWFALSQNMAKHARDIDIYHTQEDSCVYNGGMFWHTTHYADAFTSTHRSFSKLSSDEMAKFSYGIGGGPSNEHNYGTGLVYQYFLTGDKSFKETVMNLAGWVIDMDDGSKYIFRFFSKKPTGKASMSSNLYYHGPGRGSGNSVNILIDAYQVSKDKKYLLKAEELIRRCIHPEDEISNLNLDNIEVRWSYLVFLQSIGKYLDLKDDFEEKDFMYHYAKESLLHYARWMLNNEVPYNDVLDRVDLPTETWPAQDIRKSNIFDFASKYCADKKLKEQFIKKSKFLFNRCINDLNDFRTKTLTRPLAIIMNFSNMHDYFIKYKPQIKSSKTDSDFGKPSHFKPQGYYIYKIRDFINKVKY